MINMGKNESSVRVTCFWPFFADTFASQWGYIKAMDRRYGFLNVKTISSKLTLYSID